MKSNLFIVLYVYILVFHLLFDNCYLSSVIFPYFFNMFLQRPNWLALDLPNSKLNELHTQIGLHNQLLSARVLRCKIEFPIHFSLDIFEMQFWMCSNNYFWISVAIKKVIMEHQHPNHGPFISNDGGESSDLSIGINVKTLDSQTYSFQVQKNVSY